jgi:hypothetical protein
VAFRNEDLAFVVGDDVVRLPAALIGTGRAAGLADRQQDLSFRAELEDLMTKRRARRGPGRRRAASGLAAGRRRSGTATRSRGSAANSRAAPGTAAAGLRRVAVAVRHPQVPVAIDVDAVWKRHQAGAKAAHELA